MAHVTFKEDEEYYGGVVPLFSKAEIFAFLAALAGILFSVLTIYFSTSSFFIYMATIDLIEAFGIIVAHYLGTPWLYILFFIVNGLNMAILFILSVTAGFVALCCDDGVRKALCDLLNYYTADFGMHVMEFVAKGSRADVKESAFVQVICWLVMLLAALLVRVAFNLVYFKSYKQLRDECKAPWADPESITDLPFLSKSSEQNLNLEITVTDV